MTPSESPVKLARRLVLTFRLGEDLVAVPIEAVEEVLPALPLEQVPNSPAFVRGVVFVRGHLIPVLNTAERLGRTDHPRAADPHVVCLRVGGRLIGLEVDEALDLEDLTNVDSLTPREIGGQEGLLASMVEHRGRVVRLLNPERLIAKDESIELEGVPRTAFRSSTSTKENE